MSYSLLLLNTDLHVAELASHMSRGQFVRNTILAISESNRPASPSVSQASPNSAARASTPDLPSTRHEDDGNRQSGETSDAPSTLRMKSKRSGSIHSWKSGSRDGLGGVFGNASTPTLLSSPVASSTSAFPQLPEVQTRTSYSRNSVQVQTFAHGRSWEHDMEALLKVRWGRLPRDHALIGPHL